MDLRASIKKLRQWHAEAKQGTLQTADRALFDETRKQFERLVLASQQLPVHATMTQRKALRVAHAVPIVIKSGTRTIQSMTLDISSGGFSAFMESAPLGSFDVTLRFHGLSFESKARAVTRTREDSQARVSFTFEALSPQQIQVIEDAIFELALDQVDRSLGGESS